MKHRKRKYKQKGIKQDKGEKKKEYKPKNYVATKLALVLIILAVGLSSTWVHRWYFPLLLALIAVIVVEQK